MGWKANKLPGQPGEQREYEAKKRQYIIDIRGLGTDKVWAEDRERARKAICDRLMEARPGLDMFRARDMILSCVLAPGQGKKRGPKTGTPNPFYRDNPHLLTLKEQRKRGLR